MKKMFPDDKELFLNMRPYLQRIKPKEIEIQLYSETLKTAGRTDVIGEFDGVLSIIDFKTTEKEKKEEYIQNYFEQETGYSLMYEELYDIKINRIVTILVGPSVSQLFIKDRDDYKASFLNKVKTYHEIHTSSIDPTDGP